MTPEIIWTSLGIAVSVIFGIIGIYLTIKSRYPGKITFVNEHMIELFSAVGNSLDKLAVTYDGKNVDENLVLMNGAFINSGKTDISESMVEEPITLKVPDDYKWLTAKIVGSTAKATIEVKDGNTLSITTGLFRCGEFVRFHALAQIPANEKSEKSISKRLRKVIKFEHRITNTQKIDETNIKDKLSSKKELRRKGIPLLFMLIITIVLAVFFIYNGLPQNLVYPYPVDNKKIEYVKVNTNSSDSNVKLESVESKFSTSLPFDKFINKVKGNPKLEQERNREMLPTLVIISIQIFFIALLVGMQFFDYFRNKRILKIIGKN